MSNTVKLAEVGTGNSSEIAQQPPIESLKLVNVSGYNNNCGLYAVALGIRVAMAGREENQNCQKLPIAILSISPGDVQPSAKETKLQSIGSALRDSLADCIKQDASFKQACLERYINLCESVLMNRGRYEKDVETLYICSYEFLEKLKAKLIEIEKNIVTFDHKFPIAEKSSQWLESIHIILGNEVHEYKDGVDELFGVVNTCEEIFKVCTQFKQVWQGINEKDYSSEKRKHLKNIVNEWFYNKCIVLLSRSEDTLNLTLYELGLCYNELVGLIDPYNAAQYLAFRFYVATCWDVIYNLYSEALRTDVQLTADELGCWAQSLNIGLTITFPQNRLYSTEEVVDPICHVRLINLSRTHWQVQVGEKQLRVFDSTKIPRTELERDTGLESKSTFNKYDLFAFSEGLEHSQLPSDCKELRKSQAEILQSIFLAHVSELNNLGKYLRYLKNAKIAHLYPEYVELFRIESLSNKYVNLSFPVLVCTQIETDPGLPEAGNYLLNIFNIEEYKSKFDDQAISCYVKNLAASMQEMCQADQSIFGASLILKGRIPNELLRWLRGNSPLDPSPVPDVEILYSLPIGNTFESEEHVFLLKQGGRYRLKKGNRQLGSLMARNISDHWSAIRSITIIDNFIEGAIEVSSDYSEFVESFWDCFFDKVEYSKNAPEWSEFSDENNAESHRDLLRKKVDEYIELRKNEIFRSLKEKAIHSIQYYLEHRKSHGSHNCVSELKTQVELMLFDRAQVVQILSELPDDSDTLYQAIHTKIRNCLCLIDMNLDEIKSLGRDQLQVDKLLNLLKGKEVLVEKLLTLIVTIAKKRKPILKDEVVFDLDYSYFIDDIIGNKDYSKVFRTMTESISNESLDGDNTTVHLYERVCTLRIAPQPDESVRTSAFTTRFKKCHESIGEEDYLCYVFAQIINFFVQFDKDKVESSVMDYFKLVLISLQLKKSEKQAFFRLLSKFEQQYKAVSLKFNKIYSEFNQDKSSEKSRFRQFLEQYFLRDIKKNSKEYREAKKKLNNILHGIIGFDLESYNLELFTFALDEGELNNAMPNRHENFKIIIESIRSILKSNAHSKGSTDTGEVGADICATLVNTPLIVGMSYNNICDLMVSIDKNGEEVEKSREKLNALFEFIQKEDSTESVLYLYSFEKRRENVVKYIYVIDQDDSVYVDYERIVGDSVLRSTHSELAHGLGVKAAGEIIFVKKNNGLWCLIEINNGSGHYKPKATLIQEIAVESLTNICRAKGIDVSQCRFVNNLRPGMGLGSDFRMGQFYFRNEQISPINKPEQALVRTGVPDEELEPKKTYSWSSYLPRSFWGGLMLGGVAGGVLTYIAVKSTSDSNSEFGM